jgi:DNA (cytosine-5)-methyltransferase 1
VSVRSDVALPAVSLFSNCGAGDLGYARADFAFEVIAELDERRLSVARLNLPDAAAVAGDLRATWPDVVERYQERRGSQAPALLAACPPCQGMSSARGGRGRADDPDAGSRDARNLLVSVIARVAHALRPRTVVVENVPAFLTRTVRHPRTGMPISAATLLVRSLRPWYEVSGLLADLADFGIPQTRKRAFLCFIRRGDRAAAMLRRHGRAPFPRPTHAPDYGGAHVSVSQALKGLGAGSLDAAHRSTAGSGLHAVPVWDEERYRMVQTIPPGSGAGAWSNERCLECGTVAPPEETQCHSCAATLPRPIVRGEDGALRLVRGFRSSSYTRMRPDRPAATVTTASGHLGSDRTLHPHENRVLSPLECSHLQTFPTDFEWGDALERWGATNVRAMIGEAVPPGFTQQHGEVLASVLVGRPRRASITASDDRVRRAMERLALAERGARAAQAARQAS